MQIDELLRDHDLDEWAERRADLEHATGWLHLLAEVEAGRPGPWANRAACRTVPTGVFFPGHGESSQHARRVCAGCEVAAECREWAESLGPAQVGIAGGRSERQRSGERAARPPARPVVLDPDAPRCVACDRAVSGVGSDRLRSEMCTSCYAAWRRAGRPDRAGFVATRSPAA